MWLPSILAIVIAGLQTPPGRADFDMPAAVRGEAIGCAKNSPDPYNRFLFEIAPDWVRSEQHSRRGDLGWQFTDLTIDTYESSILFNLTQNKGEVSSRLSTVGNSRAELLCSPLGWLRTIRVRTALGEKLTVEERPEATIYSCGLQDGGTMHLRANASRRIIEEVMVDYVGRSNTQVTYTYSDWQPLGAGLHHPMSIELKTRTDRGGESRYSHAISHIVEMDPNTPAPPAPKLSEDAILADLRDGTLKDGLGQTVGKIEPKQAPPHASWLRRATQDVQTWFVVGGVGVLVAAGVIWRLRVRGRLM